MKTNRVDPKNSRADLPAGIRVALVDDHVMVTSMLNVMFRDYLRAEIVGISNNGTGAIEMIRRTRPEVVILDLGLPDMPTRQVIQNVLAAAAPGKVIALSSLSNPFTMHLVAQSSLHGYIDKWSQCLDSFRAAIATVLSGRLYRPPWFAGKLQEIRVMADTFVNVLTGREQDVLALVGESLTDEQIAARLGMAVSTARAYRSRLMHKVNCRNTPELIRYAIANGFTLPENNPAFRFPARVPA